MTALLDLVAENGDLVREALVPVVSIEEEKAERAAIKAAKEAVALEEAVEIVDAEEIDPDEARELRRKHKTTSGQAASLPQAGVIHSYGNAFTEADRERQIDIVVADDNGRRRSKLRRMSWVLAYAGGGTSRQALLELDRAGLGAGGSSVARVTPRLLVAGATCKILRMAGVLEAVTSEAVSSQVVVGDLQERAGHGWCPDGSWIIDRDKVSQAAKWAIEHRDDLVTVGIPVRRDALAKPIDFLRDLLRWLGLPTRGIGSNRRGSRGQLRRRTYYLDREEIAELHELSKHLLDGVLAGVEVKADELDSREAEWVRMMSEMRVVGAALAEALDGEMAAK